MHLTNIYATRHADPFLQNDSRINDVLRNAQLENPVQYKGYEDKAFFPRSHFIPAFTNRLGPLAEWQVIQNEHMKSILCTVEWAFGRNKLFYGLSDQSAAMKLLESPIAHIITNTFLVSNLLILCHGCNSNEYFNINPPSLHEYLQYGV